ncbi:hypothetical protein TQ39_13190 [Ruthenibacterium lactatiformans]|uniref:MFS transporter n=1 Tax=Ruthenibacterium lactatiformans TaxID=1550024 RepID=A0A0D8IXS0_9FIRM|nr:MFS transporter [Ruthenibacterium lactatiformans]KJF39269.1 hypothetical protein TQ39_13190 [Ruthenibacterium lactatiformans]
MATETAAHKGVLANAFKGNIWNSRIRSANVRAKEMWLGYVFGPFGVMLMYSVVNSYYNQYLTDIMGFTASRGAWIAIFMVIFPVLTKVIDATTNVLMSRLIDSTVCRQGKLRPWFLLSLPILVVSILMLFSVPVASPQLQAVWIFISYNLFYSVGYTMWNMAYQLSASLSSRNTDHRKNNSMAGQMAKNLGVGMISIFFPLIMTSVGAMMGDNYRQSYLACMALVCCVTVPLTFLQYFYTRERVTEERRSTHAALSETHTAVPEAPFAKQIKACLQSRYWILLIILILVYQVFNNLRDMSLIYYSGWVVQGNAYGQYAAIQAKFQMIAMSPMGPGIILLIPLVKKLGRRRSIWVCSIFSIVGSTVALLNAGHTLPVYAGTAVMCIGNLAFVYTYLSFLGDTIDHVEWKTGIRCDGATGALVGFVTAASAGIGQGLFNLGLMLTGYATPEKIGESAEGIALYADQPAAATAWINFSYQGSLLLVGVLAFILFRFFFDIEDKMDTITHDLQERHRAECEAKGIEYIPSYELERREQEELRRKAEEVRIRELKEYCARTGKDFDTLNNKVLARRAKKQAKKDAKKAKQQAGKR